VDSEGACATGSPLTVIAATGTNINGGDIPSIDLDAPYAIMSLVWTGATWVWTTGLA
jgi:hypothetical protein